MRLLAAHHGFTNAILARLPAEEASTLRTHLTRVRLVPQQNLIESGQVSEHVFFIEDGIASMVADTDESGGRVQVAMIGREGLVGAFALLGGFAAYGSVTVQMPGPALRVSVANLLQCFESCPVLRAACWEYVHAMAWQIMSNAASSARHTLTERCVRWLLMTHDRVDGDDVHVTHEALSLMLGVRRSGVTVTTAALQERGLIKTGRGRIRIVDRAGLEDMVPGFSPGFASVSAGAGTFGAKPTGPTAKAVA